MPQKSASRSLAALAFVAATLLSACNSTSPIIEDSVKPRSWLGGPNTIATLASRPERRLSFINVIEEDDRYGNICSEPPADAAESISSTFQAGLEVEAGAGQGGKGELANTLATAIQALSQRSQGVILFRDVSFRYCEAYLNGVLGEKEYLAKLDNAFAEARALVNEELTINKGKIGYGPFLPLGAPEQRQVTSILAPVQEDD